MVNALTQQPWDWSQYAAGGAAARGDSFSGLNPQFNNALRSMFQAAPENIRGGLGVISAYRSPEVQARLYEEALAKYGSPEAARKWVAPPGRSRHNHGFAADLRYASPEVRQWVHANAERYGLEFPLSHEPWHVELAGNRTGDMPQQSPQAMQPPQQQPQRPTERPTRPQNALRAGMGQQEEQQPENALRAPRMAAQVTDPRMFQLQARPVRRDTRPLMEYFYGAT